MKDKIPRNKKEITLRVIEDAPKELEESVEPEVVKLDQKRELKLDSSKKVEARSDLAYLNTMMAEADGGLSHGHDQDEQWLGEAAAEETTKVPIGWFILLILTIGGVLIWGASQLLLAKGSHNWEDLTDAEIMTDATVGGISKLSAAEEIAEKEKAKISYQVLDETIAKYLAADNLEEKRKYVRFRERVSPFMQEHYSRHKLVPLKYAKISEFHIVSLDNLPFVALRVDTEEGESMAMLLEDTDGSYFIDWESEVCYQSLSVDDFIEKRVSTPSEFRLYAENDLFYADEFQDEEVWRSLKLTFRNSTDYLFGYVRRGTILDKQLSKAMAGENPEDLSVVPLILSLAYPDEAKGPNTVEILDIVSYRWAYATSPDKELEHSQ